MNEKDSGINKRIYLHHCIEQDHGTVSEGWLNSPSGDNIRNCTPEENKEILATLQAYTKLITKGKQK